MEVNTVPAIMPTLADVARELSAENTALHTAIDRIIKICEQTGNPPDPEWARRTVLETAYEVKK